ncbi:hypothetical protein J132_06813 [Termitomyces sp. J132]|nr:hypothetical protein J132_06813 [Termitomyces sp. J132]
MRCANTKSEFGEDFGRTTTCFTFATDDTHYLGRVQWKSSFWLFKFNLSVDLSNMSRDEQPQSSQYERPPLDGSLYVPELYDWQYHHNPTQTAFLYSVGESGLQAITYKEFVPAIHRAARLVAGMIGIDISGEKAHYPAVVILSAADTISVFTTLIGMLRLGVVCFPISPRFSDSVVAHLSQKAGATHILVDGHNPRLFQVARNALVELNEQRGVGTQTPLPNLHALPIFDEIYGDYGHFDPLPETSYPLSSHAMLVHSSNSTSDYPKVIPWTVQLILATTTIPANSSHDLSGAVFSCHGIELFHPIGLHFLFWLPAYGLKLAVFKPSVPAVSPTSELTFQGMQETRAHYIVTHTRFLEPSTYKDLAVLDRYVELQGIQHPAQLARRTKST